MNQHDQTREALQQVRRDIESLTALQNGTVNHIVKSACGTLDRVLQTLAAEPAPLVRLTDEDIEALRHKTFSTNNPFCPCDAKTMRKAAHAIMDAMDRPNK